MYGTASPDWGPKIPSTAAAHQAPGTAKDRRGPAEAADQPAGSPGRPRANPSPNCLPASAADSESRHAGKSRQCGPPLAIALRVTTDCVRTNPRVTPFLPFVRTCLRAFAPSSSHDALMPSSSRTRPPVGEEGEEIGDADGAAAVEVGGAASLRRTWAPTCQQ